MALSQCNILQNNTIIRTAVQILLELNSDFSSVLEERFVFPDTLNSWTDICYIAKSFAVVGTLSGLANTVLN